MIMKEKIYHGKGNHGKIIKNLISQSYRGKRNKLFKGKDPTTFFREMREKKSKRIVH